MAGKEVLRGGSPARRAEIGNERRSRTRLRLLAAAARVVAERGEEGATIDACISAAGVARGTFYNYFPAREDVIEALWTHVGRDPYRRIDKDCAAIADPAARLATKVALLVHGAARDGAWGWTIYGLSAGDATLNDELRRFPVQDLKAGHAAGRFDLDPSNAQRDLVVGTVRSAMRAALTEQVDGSYVPDLITGLLAALGMKRPEARRMAQHAAHQAEAGQADRG